MALPAAVAAHRMIPAAAQRRPARIDWAGAAVLSGALVCLLLAWAATGINTIARTIGGAARAAAVTTVPTARMMSGTMVPVESGYTTAFVIAAAVGVLALLAALAVPRQPRAQPESAAEPALA